MKFPQLWHETGKGVNEFARFISLLVKVQMRTAVNFLLKLPIPREVTEELLNGNIRIDAKTCCRDAANMGRYM